MVDIRPTHELSRVWHYVEDSQFKISYDALEEHFNMRARSEGLLPEKFWIHIKNIELNPKERILDIQSELYRLLEN